MERRLERDGVLVLDGPESQLRLLSGGPDTKVGGSDDAHGRTPGGHRPRPSRQSLVCTGQLSWANPLEVHVGGPPLACPQPDPWG